LKNFVFARIGVALALASASAGAAIAASPSMLPSQFPGRVLAVHNMVRAQVGSAGLVWDNALGTAAARYALQLAMTNVFQHSDRKARPGTGENLWMGTRGSYSVETMVGHWASERRLFVPGTFPNNSRSGNWEDIGHYTQMIWPTTTRVGCALASNATRDYLVCRYSPAGNIDGHVVQASQRY
jgi:hypothetical protein